MSPPMRPCRERIWEDMTRVIQISLSRAKEITRYQYSYFVLLIKPQHTTLENRQCCCLVKMNFHSQ